MKRLLTRIHQDEEGLEALQVVMIIAIAAVILAILKIYWPTIREWFVTALTNITGWNDPSK